MAAWQRTLRYANFAMGRKLLVACPGRLLDHIRYGSIDLRNLEVLVLDEADQMFDMGFLPNLKEILKSLPDKRQTLMFSATMPAEIRKLANEILQQPKTVQIANTAPVSTVSHSVYLSERDQKTPLLIALLAQANGSSVLVFTRTKHQAIRLSEQIKKAGSAELHFKATYRKLNANMPWMVSDADIFKY